MPDNHAPAASTGFSARQLSGFVFVTGLVITAIEITASRALAPYFGTSLYVWANVIGITLIALATGYSTGGKLADRHPERHVLAFVVLAAGVYTTLIPVLVRVVAKTLIATTTEAGLQFVVVVASLLAAALLFFPPIFLLGMVSPFAIRLAATTVEATGRAAGRIFAASTVGSIVGIFLPAFFLIPFVGVRETFFLGSAVLILLSAIVLGRRGRWAFALLLLPVAGYLLTRTMAIRPDGVTVEERDSAYQYVRVTQSDDGTHALRINDGIGIQSLYHPDRILFGGYYDYFSALPFINGRAGERYDALIVGLAGGTLSRQLDAFAGPVLDLHMDGVEIDPEIVALAKKHFALERDNLTIHTADGRMFLATTSQQYDLIITDAYSQQVYIAPHLTTQEYFQLARERLRPGGIFSINVNAFRDDAPLLQRILATLESVFPHVAVKRLPGVANHLILATTEQLSLVGLEERVPLALKDHMATIGQAAAPTHTVPARQVFTDNRAPVELLTEAMFFDLLAADRAAG